MDEMYLADTGGQYLCVSHPLPPRPTLPLAWLRPALQDLGPLLMPPFCRDGTTDITRTVHWGTPTPLQKVLAPRGRPSHGAGAVVGGWMHRGEDGDIPSAPCSAPAPCRP